MATFSLCHFLQTGHSHSNLPLYPKKSVTRTKFSVSCRTRGRKGEKQEYNINNKLLGLLLNLKDSLSPKQKGDWKDLVLMSFSFAVYVYISQRIVSAYCAWVSLLKQSL